MHNFHLAKDRITRDEKAEELQRIRSEQEASLSRRHPEESPFHREKSDKRAIRYAGGGPGLGVIGTGNNESNTSSTGNTVKSPGKSPNKKNSRMKEQISVASSVSEKKHPSSPTNRPQFLVGTMSPQDSQKFATEIEGRVLKKISNTVFGDGESDVGMNYPVKLPEARYQLIELHGILDEMINETRYHQQVLLGSNTTFEATARLCLFDKATNMPTTVAPLGILSSTGSQHGGTTSMPAIESKSSGGKLSGGIPATITINKNISIGHSGGSGGGVSANSSSSVKSPVPPSSGSVGGGSIGSVGSGSHARDAYTNRFEGSSSRIDSINQSVKNNTVRQIYSNINSNGTSSIRPLDSSVSGLEQKAQKFSYDIILAQLTNQAVVKASRLHKYYRKHLIAVEREYHNEMESMRKTTEVVKTRLHIYETKELASQRRVQALLKGAVKHDEHHFESDIVLPEITEYLAKNSSDPETASATGGIDHKGLTGGVGGDIAEMLAHQLTEERHNNSKYIEELTEEVEALQKKFNVAVQANRRVSNRHMHMHIYIGGDGVLLQWSIQMLYGN